MLSAELALADVDVVVLERRPDHVLAGSRAGGIHARTIEILDQRGVVDRFLAEGQAVQAVMFGKRLLDMSDFPTRYPFSLGIWQKHIERIRAGWVFELGVSIQYGREVEPCRDQPHPRPRSHAPRQRPCGRTVPLWEWIDDGATTFSY